MSNQEQGYIQAPVGTTRQKNPFWYRENGSNTFGVTAQPSNVNPQLGIEDIQLKPGSQAQLQHGILMSGILKAVIGSISFQIKLSHAGYPFVQTISTELGVDEKGDKTYWEHIILKPAVKAQIMRFFEALQMGSAVQVPANQYQAPAPMGYAPQAYNQAPPAYGQSYTQAPAPQPQAYPNYGAMYQGVVGQNNVGTSTPVGANGQGNNQALVDDDLPV